MNKIIPLFLTFAFSLFLNAQEIKNYTWEEKPEFEKIPEGYKNEPVVILFDKRWIHTRVGDYAYASFVLNHFAIKINKAEEINKYNKIKADDNGYTRTVRDFHARVIKPNGEIKLIPQEKIIETEVEKVKSIVFEGVEAGDILEYYFILKENPKSAGIEIFQKDVPLLYGEFKTTTSGIIWYNIYSSSEFKSNNKTFSVNNIPAFKEEKNSKNLKNLIKIIYFVDSNLGGRDWEVIMKSSFKKPSFSYFNKTSAREFIEKLNIKNLNTEEKLIKIDSYIKENFDFVQRGEKAEEVEDLNSGKLKLSSSDIFDLYGFTFKELEIPYKIAVGLNRFYGEIDKTSHVYLLPHEFMYYIPETKKYLSPYEKYLSYGFPAHEVQGEKSIIYEPKVGITYDVFPIAPSDFTLNETISLVSLKDDLTQAIIEKTHSSTGYRGQWERQFIKELKEETEEKELTNFLKNRLMDEVDITIKDHTFENTEIKNNYTNTPIVIKAKIETKEAFTENAGNLLLVNLGKVLGNQTNLYQENERKTDIDLSYAKQFKHKIIFTIPQGYEVESLKGLEFNQEMNYDKTKNYFFKSVAKVENNQVIVTVEEVCKSINYPVKVYQEYRKVRNAAADFYKSTLVLKPKK